MKVMKKLLALGLTLSMLLPASAVVAATTSVDYSAEIAQIKNLMAQCDARGISYDYEMVNYKTIDRFEDSINEDIKDGISEDIINYNISAVDKLCAETIANLEAYIDGSKIPQEVTLPDMANITSNGKGLTDGNAPAFSIGYGHGNSLIKDISQFNDFGSTNAQIEVGPTNLFDYKMPFEAEDSSADYSLEYYTEDAYAGDLSLRAEVKTPKSTNVYVRFKQKVVVKPNTTYNFGTYAKVTDKSTNGLSVILRANNWNNGIDITPCSEWTKFSGSFTTGKTQVSTVLNFVVEGEAVCLFDNIYMYEAGTTDNIVPNGDLEGNTAVPFTVTKYGNALASVRESTGDKQSGKRSVYVLNNSPISNNVYVLLTQEIPCNPNKTYTFGLSAKYKNRSTNGLNISLFGHMWDYDSRVPINVSDSWRNYSGTYTTGPDQYTLNFSIVIEGEAECWFDDIYVREQGIKKNIFVNGTVESGAAMSSIRHTLHGLRVAEANNVGISLLLSQHYFPANVHGVTYKSDAESFFKYDVAADAAKTIQERHIRTLLPLVKDYKSLQNICLSNEPQFRTSNYPAHYNPLFRQYLLDKHGSLANIKSAHGKSYSSIDSIVMEDVQAGISNLPLFYDWMSFNDKTFTDWHKFMAEIVEEYTDVPKSAKIQNTFRWDGDSGNRTELTRGTDPELLSEFCEYSGNDVTEFYDDLYSYWYAFMFYDYVSSTTGKPMFNSETHTIRDGHISPKTPYEPLAAAHTANHLWMSAVRGNSMHSMWVWGKSNNSASVIYQSILSRPDAVAKAGKTALDLARLSKTVDEFAQQQPRVALFYSKPSRVHNASNHMRYLSRAYQALINAGVKVGFVSENSLDKLSDYDALILGGVTSGTTAAMTAVNNFMNNGGKVLSFGDAFTKTEYGISRSSKITSNANCTTNSSTPLANRDYTITNNGIANAVVAFISNNKLARVELKDTNGNSLTGLDWSYVIDDKRVLVNVTNLFGDSTKNINVYLDGQQLTGMNELISGTKNITTAAVKTFEPQLLEFSYAPAEIYGITLSPESGVISWEYTEGTYEGAKIYRLNSKGQFLYVSTVRGTSYTCDKPGTYVVRAALDNTDLDKLTQIDVVFGNEFELALSNINTTMFRVSADVNVKNTTDNAMFGVVKIETLTTDGNVENYQYQMFRVGSNKNASYKVHLPITANTAKIRISAIDSKEKGNSIAETVEYDL